MKVIYIYFHNFFIILKLYYLKGDMMIEPIQIVGIKELDEPDKDIVNKLANEYFVKIKRKLKNFTSLLIHIKCSNKDGKKKMYSINARVTAPTRMFESTKAADWDLARTLHKAFKDLEREIEHKLHTDDQHDKVSERLV